MIDLVAQERKFVANSQLKNAEKINFSLNLVPIKTVLLLPFFLKDPVYPTCLKQWPPKAYCLKQWHQSHFLMDRT